MSEKHLLLTFEKKSNILFTHRWNGLNIIFYCSYVTVFQQGKTFTFGGKILPRKLRKRKHWQKDPYFSLACFLCLVRSAWWGCWNLSLPKWVVRDGNESNCKNNNVIVELNLLNKSEPSRKKEQKQRQFLYFNIHFSQKAVPSAVYLMHIAKLWSITVNRW